MRTQRFMCWARLLDEAGLDARTITERIGHTDPAFTLKRYAHVFEEQRCAAAIPLRELLATPAIDPETNEHESQSL